MILIMTDQSFCFADVIGDIVQHLNAWITLRSSSPLLWRHDAVENFPTRDVTIKASSEWQRWRHEIFYFLMMSVALLHCFFCFNWRHQWRHWSVILVVTSSNFLTSHSLSLATPKTQFVWLLINLMFHFSGNWSETYRRWQSTPYVCVLRKSCKKIYLHQ